MENIEYKVDLLLGLRQDFKHTKKTVKRMSTLGLTLLIASALVLGAFVTTLTYIALTQQGDIELTGNMETAVYWDDVLMAYETNSIPMDLDSLVFDNTETFTHTISSASTDGNWDLNFDLSGMPWLNIHSGDPGDDEEFAGVYFDATNNGESLLGAGVHLPIMAGTEEEIIFSYSLDSHFMPTDNPCPWDLKMELVPHANDAPEAGSDSYSYLDLVNSQVVMYVLSNDFDFENDDLDITSVDSNNLTYPITIEGIFPDEYLIYHLSIADSGTRIAWYTITDGEYTVWVQITLINMQLG